MPVNSKSSDPSNVAEKEYPYRISDSFKTNFGNRPVFALKESSTKVRLIKYDVCVIA